MTPFPKADVRSGHDVPTVAPGKVATEPAPLIQSRLLMTALGAMYWTAEIKRFGRR
jgi:hypothetical protein